MDFKDGSPFSAFITNLGAYNEGELKGEWIDFPVSRESYENILERIGIGEGYEEVFITDYDNNTELSMDFLSEYESVDELNMLASILIEMPETDYECLCAVCDVSVILDVKDMINTALNLDNVYFDPNITTNAELGKSIVADAIKAEDKYKEQLVDNLENYIDYEGLNEFLAEDEDREELTEEYVFTMSTDDFLQSAYDGVIGDFINYESFGRDIAISEGTDVTEEGYVELYSFEERYDGEVPDEYRITGEEKEDDTDNVTID